MRSDRKTVWFMTENPDKFREAESILASQGIKIQHLKRTKVEVQDPSLEKIARFAVKSAPIHPPGLLVVEDSGLFIDALGGFPGPFSSYVYNTIGLKGILSLMRNQRKRNAYFQTSIAVASTNVPPRVFTGTVRGSVSREIRGTA
ncbi:MAG TPA: non-canonical purine NTP pyrophosphatase, partial [Candidatus Bathyarchaeia archaeon]